MAEKTQQKPQVKIKILKIDTYDLDREAIDISAMEEKGFVHYLAIPFQYGSGRVHYFRKA